MIQKFLKKNLTLTLPLQSTLTDQTIIDTTPLNTLTNISILLNFFKFQFIQLLQNVITVL